MWVNIDPHLLLNLFLPALIFSDSFNLNIHVIKRCFTQCLLLACPGVLLSTVLTACFARFVIIILINMLMPVN
jgi:NhaP-type Na+/H+ or K+/H+ antiporter